MPMTKQSNSLFSALRVLADELGDTKQAAAKKKADESSPGVDPGGHEGKSTHPSADAASDNGTQAASEGARSAENDKDVKSQQGAPSVNNPSTVAKQDSVQLNIGLHQSETGGDSKVEDGYKDRLPDPGGYQGATTHPATTGGEKYGSFKFAELHKLQVDIANDLLADIANGATAPKVASTTLPAATQHFDQLSAEIEKLATAVNQNVAGNPEAAAAIAAGYNMAATLGIDKAAAQREVAAVIEEAITDAHFDADLFGHAYLTAQEAIRKQAAGEVNEGEDHNKETDSSSGANRSESAAGGGGAGAAAGGSAEGGAVAGGGGGGGEDYASLGDLLGGGGGGGAPGGAPGAGGGQPSREEILTELVSALQELGIPIEQLAAAGGGGGGGMPPGGGAPPIMPPGGGGGPVMPPPGGDPMAAGGGMMPPPGGDPMASAGAPPPSGGGGAPPGMPPDEGMKLANACRRFQLTGKYRLKMANDNTRERELRDRLKNYVLEVIRR